jgi:hypothetical protein
MHETDIVVRDVAVLRGNAERAGKGARKQGLSDLVLNGLLSKRGA